MGWFVGDSVKWIGGKVQGMATLVNAVPLPFPLSLVTAGIAAIVGVFAAAVEAFGNLLNFDFRSLFNNGIRDIVRIPTRFAEGLVPGVAAVADVGESVFKGKSASKKVGESVANFLVTPNESEIEPEATKGPGGIRGMFSSTLGNGLLAAGVVAAFTGLGWIPLVVGLGAMLFSQLTGGLGIGGAISGLLGKIFGGGRSSAEAGSSMDMSQSPQAGYNQMSQAALSQARGVRGVEVLPEGTEVDAGVRGAYSNSNPKNQITR